MIDISSKGKIIVMKGKEGRWGREGNGMEKRREKEGEVRSSIDSHKEGIHSLMAYRRDEKKRKGQKYTKGIK